MGGGWGGCGERGVIGTVGERPWACARREGGDGESALCLWTQWPSVGLPAAMTQCASEDCGADVVTNRAREEAQSAPFMLGGDDADGRCLRRYV